SALAVALFAINFILREPESIADAWIAKGSFEIYFGWVTAATLVNFAIMLKFLNALNSVTTETILAVLLILIAAGLAIVIRLRLRDYFYPLAIAWALTAIAVKQSGQTAVVVACALGVVACLIASASFVMSLNSSESRATSL
ncbi:MAG TPA: hypothetical protein VJV05_15185, partial [Pyrinomonadaceae bacterium]|nr:hypothetical protein [Pyrinomonadaceae bacterium]